LDLEGLTFDRIAYVAKRAAVSFLLAFLSVMLQAAAPHCREAFAVLCGVQNHSCP